MEIVILILVGVILFIVLTNFRQEVKKNMQILNRNVINVRKELESLKEKGINAPTDKQNVVKKEPVPLKPLEVSGQRLKTASSESAEINKPAVSKPIVKKPIEAASKAPDTIAETLKKSVTIKPSIQKTAPAKQRVVKPKRDYEKLIGENWLNKIGIAILVIGIGFFVKYAIDQNWIGEIGRVGIGMLTGGILIGIAHFLRKKYRAFSSVLIGGGISVFYYTIAIAYHDYQIFNQATAFAIMVGITLLSAVASVLYDRKELAIIALIGGFTSPFMVQGETGNYIVFFTYIAILNSGMLILSYFKKWAVLSKLALGFTVLFFGTWVITTNLQSDLPANWAIIFASIFFIQFLGMSLIYNFVKKIKFNAWEFAQLSGITALYYGVMTYILATHEFGISAGFFTVIMSGFFILLALFAQSRKGTDKALVYLLTGKAIAFLTITPILLFDGNYMTLFWGIEAVVILALGQFANMKILKNASILLTLATLFALVKDWMNDYIDRAHDLTPFANGTFFTGLFVIATLVASFILVRREKDELGFAIRKNEYYFTIGALIFSLSYLTILFELIYQLGNLYYAEGAELILWIFHFTLILVGLLVAKFKKADLMRQIFFFIACAGTVGYLIFAQENNFAILKDALIAESKAGYYFLHYVLTAGLITTLLFLKGIVKNILEDQKHINWFIAILSVVGLIMATAELDQVIGYIFGPSHGLSKVLSHTRTEGYTILWGLYSFVLMIRGMQKQSRILRILALVLFSITLIKLFVFDIQNISEAGKIVAFISLGVLLLVISFMYQKLKTLIVDGKID